MRDYILVFLTQIVFIYFRTINVQHVAHGEVWKSLLSGSMVNVSWLVSIALGVTGIQHGDYGIILVSLSGGLIGTLYGMRKHIKFTIWIEGYTYSYELDEVTNNHIFRTKDGQNVKTVCSRNSNKNQATKIFKRFANTL